MKCYNCGKKLSEDEAICPHCGSDQGFSPELLYRAKINDQLALTELYNKTKDCVYYTVTALIKDNDAALDIMQDSYIKAFNQLNQLEKPEKFKPWIKRIAHNHAIDYLRKNKPILFSEMESDDSDAPLDFEDTYAGNLPEQVADQKETERLMREILDSLPDEQRAVISMHYYEEMPVNAIAAELNVSEGTIKSRLNYARKKIETKVRELEKKGVKLYGLAPIPFLRALFRSLGNVSAKLPRKMLSQIISLKEAELSAAAAAAAASAQTATAHSFTGSGAGILGFIKTSVTAKVIAGVLATGVVAGSFSAIATVTERNPRTGVSHSAVASPAIADNTQYIMPTLPTVAANRAGNSSDAAGQQQATAQPTTAENVNDQNDVNTADATTAADAGQSQQSAGNNDNNNNNANTATQNAETTTTYTDPNGIFQLTLPQIWTEAGGVVVSESGGNYTVALSQTKTYDGNNPLSDMTWIYIYADPNYSPSSSEAIIAQNDTYTACRALVGIGYPPASSEAWYTEYTADREKLAETAESVIASFRFT